MGLTIKENEVLIYTKMWVDPEIYNIDAKWKNPHIGLYDVWFHLYGTSRIGKVYWHIQHQKTPHGTGDAHPVESMLVFIHVSGISYGKVRKVGEGCGVGRSLPPWLYHETHLSITVSSNPISYLTASFQEEKIPRLSHLLYSTGQSQSECWPFQGEGVQTCPCFLRIKQCKCSRGRSWMAASWTEAP